MLTTPAPSDQRNGVRPISFVLDDGGRLGSPITLAIRPEDLTRTETMRATVNQTLGRDRQGWVDFYGEGLPSVTIAGHTGWRHAAGLGSDGAAAFKDLNNLVQHAYPAAKQRAIDTGSDPSGVKLIFVDMLDGFVWSVLPTSFVLRRSKSRPLLFQYNIVMQAVSTAIDAPLRSPPIFGSISGGADSLFGALSQLEVMAGQVAGWVNDAVSFVDRGLAPIAQTVKRFVDMSNQVFRAAHTVVMSVQNGVGTLSNRVIGMAGDLGKVGANIFRTISSIANLPSNLKANLSRVGAAFNEVVCIFSNSLRPRQTYENYDGLYGASNCSSTTGGRPDSPYSNQNAFALIENETDIVAMNTVARAGVSTLSRYDPVLAPVSISEVGRHLTNVVDGTNLSGAARRAWLGSLVTIE